MSHLEIKEKIDGLSILEQAKLVRSRAEEISKDKNIAIGKAFDLATKEILKGE